MVGIVIVSHSRLLVEGVCELATQMTQGKVNIAVSGGIDDPENPIGTDPAQISFAIEEVFDPSGVLILMDLGSALLSTEMALELLPKDVVAKVELCSAPIVEGAIAASVAAVSGLSLKNVKKEAMKSLLGKQTHLDDITPQQQKKLSVNANMLISELWQVQNPNGLHTRPSSDLVAEMAKFESTVQLNKDGTLINAKSISAIASLNVQLDDKIKVHAEGVDAQQAIDAFMVLANTHFNEDIAQQKIKSNIINKVTGIKDVAGAFVGVAVCEGVVTGPVVHVANKRSATPARNFTDIDNETKLISSAITDVCREIQTEIDLMSNSKLHEEIFNAHLIMLKDPELAASVNSKITNGVIAEQAWLDSITDLENLYSSFEGTYLQERESDVRDIGDQVMNKLCGLDAISFNVSEPSILIATDLSPSDVKKLDSKKIIAICLSKGGKTSHSVILAKAMGIPILVKVDNGLESLKNGQIVTVDAFTGLLWFDVDFKTKESLALKRRTWLQETVFSLKDVHQTAVTLDDVSIPVQANIDVFNDIALALENGADGVGLLRTEFLFQNYEKLPTEDEQFESYKKIVLALDGKPLTIRSFDFGGDKSMFAYPLSAEENPFLGLRGVRICLADHSFFKVQLRALLRAHAVYPNIQILIPMIACVEEVLLVKALIEECKLELTLSEQDNPLKLGIMIEVPAAVFNCDSLAQEVDFFSIGTNDLTQYIMAADRGNSAVSYLVDYNQNAVIKAIELVCIAAKKAKIPVRMCGEMAGDYKVTEQLIGFGIEELSACSLLLPKLKSTIRKSYFDPLNNPV